MENSLDHSPLFQQDLITKRGWVVMCCVLVSSGKCAWTLYPYQHFILLSYFRSCNYHVILTSPLSITNSYWEHTHTKLSMIWAKEIQLKQSSPQAVLLFSYDHTTCTTWSQEWDIQRDIIVPGPRYYHLTGSHIKILTCDASCTVHTYLKIQSRIWKGTFLSPHWRQLPAVNWYVILKTPPQQGPTDKQNGSETAQASTGLVYRQQDAWMFC